MKKVIEEVSSVDQHVGEMKGGEDGALLSTEYPGNVVELTLTIESPLLPGMEEGRRRLEPVADIAFQTICDGLESLSSTSCGQIRHGSTANSYEPCDEVQFPGPQDGRSTKTYLACAITPVMIFCSSTPTSEMIV